MGASAERVSAKAFKKKKKKNEAVEDELGFVIDSTPSKVPQRLEFVESANTAESLVTADAQPNDDARTSVGESLTDGIDARRVEIVEASEIIPAGSSPVGTSDEEDGELSSESASDEDEDVSMNDDQLEVFRDDEHQEVILREGIAGDEDDAVSFNFLLRVGQCVLNFPAGNGATLGCCRAVLQRSRCNSDMHSLRRGRSRSA
jgi:hypothetical protein